MRKLSKYLIVLFLLFTLTGCIEKHSDVRVKVESSVIQRGDWQKNSNYNPFFDLEFIVNDDWKIYSDKELIDAFPLAKAVANQRGEFEDVEKKDAVFCYFVKEKTNNTNISAIIIKLRDEEEQKLNEETYILSLMSNIDDEAKSYKMSDNKR